MLLSCWPYVHYYAHRCNMCGDKRFMRNALGAIYTCGDQLSPFSAEKQAKNPYLKVKIKVSTNIWNGQNPKLFFLDYICCIRMNEFSSKPKYTFRFIFSFLSRNYGQDVEICLVGKTECQLRSQVSKHVCLSIPFIKEATQKGSSKEHCMCIKEKQNTSSQSFLRNLTCFYAPFRYLWLRCFLLLQ